MNGQECHKVHIQTSFFIAMLLTRQSDIGALTSLSANMRKVESNALAQTNDKNETLYDSMQHTDHASFNESPFKSMHHIVDKPSPGRNNSQSKNVESLHNVNTDQFTNKPLIDKETDFRNIDESDVPFLSRVFNCAFELVSCKRDERSVNVINIHSVMNEFSAYHVRDNEELAHFFQKVLNFGNDFPVNKRNGFGHGITMICFLFQRLH